jgi:hypothetical protein
VQPHSSSLFTLLQVTALLKRFDDILKWGRLIVIVGEHNKKKHEHNTTKQNMKRTEYEQNRI